jgi:hypothetical protein
MGGSWLAMVFFICFGVISVGLLWFRIFRPMLEDFGVLRSVDAVNGYEWDTPPYVTSGAVVDSSRGGLPPRGNAEEEKWSEAEAAPEARPSLSAADINRLLEQAREEATARALGTLIGGGLVVEGSRSRAMEALFGPPGRKHTRVRHLVAEAEGAAKAARPEAEEEPGAPRVISVNAGRPNERKILL